eukprot:TRINITY_DN966_c0_g3_i1.p1 TRINITY_DN966_c0_g3~~TRINITY_DN966_c0_g3_i1.p1  ORF type:complete len:497 (+),score=184.85 TRINITY_DN966_c0_g3_i1:162-1652(+)
MEEHVFAGIISLAACTILLITVVTGFNLTERSVSFLSPSGFSIIFGLLIGAACHLAGQDFTFSPELFFYVLLPPLIFEAGYTMKRRDFFKNVGPILIYAVVGTSITAGIIGFSMYGLSIPGDSKVQPSLNTFSGCLLFGILIAPTDTVGVLGIIGRKNIARRIKNILLGECTLNDPVAIVLFTVIKDANIPAGSDIDIGEAIIQALLAIAKFIGILFGSGVCGVFFGLISSYIFQRFKFNNPPVEFLLLIFLAYYSYVIADLSHLSGIASLLFCGIVNAHYCSYNLSKEAKTCANEIFKVLSIICENVIYLYIGVTAFSIPYKYTSKDLITLSWAFFFVIMARIFTTLVLTFIYNLTQKTERRITIREQILVACCSVRGAVSFALAINVPEDEPTRDPLILTTLFIVIATTLFLGTATIKVVDVLDLEENETTIAIAEQSRRNVNLSNQDHLHKVWVSFDEWLKQYFGGKPREINQNENSINEQTVLNSAEHEKHH